MYGVGIRHHMEAIPFGMGAKGPTKPSEGVKILVMARRERP